MKRELREYMKRENQKGSPLRIISRTTYKILIILSIFAVLIILFGIISATVNSLGLSEKLPSFLKIEFTISPDTLDTIKDYVNKTIQELG